MAEEALRGLALCAGAGGLELGLRLALGRRYRTVGYVEREAYAAAILVARMEDQILDQAPLWDDLTTFDGVPWRGSVDCIIAGFPCQPVSVAGKRQAQVDSRWLWPHVARIIGEVGPRIVFVENVPGIRKVLDEVIGGLADLGFAAEWDCFSAAEAGASHLRERVFILAHRNSERRQQDSRGTLEDEGTTSQQRSEIDGQLRSNQSQGSSSVVAHATVVGRGSGRTKRDGFERQPQSDERCIQTVGVAHCTGLEGRSGAEPASANERTPRSAGDEMGNSPSSRCSGGEDARADQDDASKGGRGAQPKRGCGFAPAPDALSVWAGVPAHAQPAICRVAPRLAFRNDRIRLLGNGVVPAVAAGAFLALAQRLVAP